MSRQIIMKTAMSTTLYCQRLAVAFRRSPHSLLSSRLPPVNAPHCRNCRMYATSTENLPRVVQPSLWYSIVPKAFRRSDSSPNPAKPQRAKEWNPATFFICIFLVIGSNAIQMLVLKNEYSTFSRKADAKIKLLKDVLDRVQRGENVDVEKALGTGDEEQEQEWRDVLRHLEDQGQMWQLKDRKRQRRRPQNEQEDEVEDAEEATEQSGRSDTDSANSNPTSKVVQHSDFY